MKQRIILKIPNKMSFLLKGSIKALGAHWDDLFDAWSLPVECMENLKKILNEARCKHEIKVFGLPDEHVKNDRSTVMYGKYATLLKKVTNDEKKLLIEIENYERNTKRYVGDHPNGRPIFDLPWAMHLYKDEPSPEKKNSSAYLIEKDFWKRLVMIDALRSEIDEIHQELQALEMSQKKLTKK